jgi:ABC-2 type transport system ATP-binding protein
MCTHLLLEAEGLADQVAVLQDGTALVDGSPGELTRQYWPDHMVRLGAEDPTGLDAVRHHDGVLGFERADGLATVRLDRIERIPDIVLALAQAGVRVTRVEPHEPTLEDLYFAVRQGAGRSRLGTVEGSAI